MSTADQFPRAWLPWLGCPFADMANAKALAKVLKPFAAEHGVSFVKYDEAEKCKDAKTLTAELKQHKELCSAILQLPKTASKSTIKDALEEIYEDFLSTWKPPRGSQIEKNQLTIEFL